MNLNLDMDYQRRFIKALDDAMEGDKENYILLRKWVDLWRTLWRSKRNWRTD